MRRVGHRLHATGHDDLGVAGADAPVGLVDGVHAGEAHLVDRGGRDVHRDAAVDGGLAGGDLPGAGLEDVAHVDVVDLVAGESGLVECGADGEPAELDGGERGERARQLADRGAGPGEDDDGWVHEQHSVIGGGGFGGADDGGVHAVGDGVRDGDVDVGEAGVVEAGAVGRDGRAPAMQPV